MLPAAADLPPTLQERVVCSVAAAAKYQIPANLVLAVAENEGGKPGQWVRNSNGTHDVGPMQFNTAYLAELARYGISAEHVASAGCYSFDLAAWRLRGHLKNDRGDIWTRAANYHSRTPQYNAIYRANIIKRAQKWATWLQTHYVTSDYYNTQRNTAAQPIATAIPTTKVEQSPRSAPAVGPSQSGYVPRTISFKPQARQEPKTPAFSR